MLTFYQKTLKDKQAHATDKFKTGSWVCLENPSEDEIKRIASELNLEEGHLRDAVDPYEVPRLEIEQSGAYIFTRIPHRSGQEIETTPLLIIVGEAFVVTVCRIELPFLNLFKNSERAFYTTQKNKLFLQLFSEINTTYSSFLTTINRQVRASRISLERITNKDIAQFVGLEATLNDFMSALVPNNTILQKLLSGKYLAFFPEDMNLVEDLSLSTGQLIETCKADLRTLVNIREAYSTIVTNNLNRVLKLLASLTIVLTVPTFIASLFGMNVPLPLDATPHAFYLILGFISLLSILLIFIFYRNEWL